MILFLFDSHAVKDETQEDEGVVAIVDFHIFHNPLTHLSKVAWFWKLALVHKAGPWTNGEPTPVDPLFGHAGWESFGEPEPVKTSSEKRQLNWRMTKFAQQTSQQWSRPYWGHFTMLERGNLRKTVPQAHIKTTCCALNMFYFIPKICPYFAMIPAPPVPVGWASSALNKSPALLSMSTRQFSPFGAPDTIYSLYALRIKAKTY